MSRALIELIGDDKPSHGGGRGVRLKEPRTSPRAEFHATPKAGIARTAGRAART